MAWLFDSDLQWFLPIPVFFKARFGMWKEILNETPPVEKYQYALGMWHYGQGMALAHLSDISRAQEENDKLNQIIKKGPSSNTLGKNGIMLLKIALIH